MKVIVADDSLLMRKIIQNELDELGYKGVGAVNGKKVLEILENDSTDIGLVILDWNMPVMDGLEVVKVLQEDKRFKEIPVLMVSTESEDARINEALKAGAKDYLCKPFTSEEIAEKIIHILK